MNNKLKCFKWLLILMLVCLAKVYAGDISKPYDFSAGDLISASKMNADFDLLYSTINDLDGANIKADALDFTEIADTLGLDAETEINLGSYNLNIDLDSTGDLVIKDGGTAVHIFRDDGNVGIGTTSPGGKLVVSTATTATPALFVEDSGAHAGNVGIGTAAPAYKLEVNGMAKASSFRMPAGSFVTEDGTVLTIRGVSTHGVLFDYGSGGFTFRDMDASYRTDFRINSLGNVGIGTTDPGSYNLKVNGSSNFIGAITSTNTSNVVYAVYAPNP